MTDPFYTELHQSVVFFFPLFSSLPYYIIIIEAIRRRILEKIIRIIIIVNRILLDES